MAGNKKSTRVRKGKSGTRTNGGAAKVGGMLASVMTPEEVAYLPEEYPLLDVQLCNLITSFINDPNPDIADDLAYHMQQIACSWNMLHGGVGVLNMRTPEARTIVSAIKAMEDISARYIKTTVLLVRETEAKTLMAARAMLVTILEQIPVILWRRAEKDVRILYTALTIRDKKVQASLKALEAEITPSMVSA